MSLTREISAKTKCSICTEPFVDCRELPCVHRPTICPKCLQNYRKMKTTIEEGLACSLCRATHNTDAYLSSTVAALPMQLDSGAEILGMAALTGNKFYLLRTERHAVESAQVERRLLTVAGLIRLQLPDTLLVRSKLDNGKEAYRYPSKLLYRAQYTQCNSLLFQVQLWYSKDATGKTLQLEICDPYLAEMVENPPQLTNSVTLGLDPPEIGQPSNTSQNLILKSPKELFDAGLHAAHIHIEVTGSSRPTSLTVTVPDSQAVLSPQKEYTNKTIAIPISPIITFPSSVLEVYDTEVNAPNPGIVEVKKPTSIVPLPKFKPTDMVSCCYYDCLYIGDESYTSIHRVESSGRVTKWPVQSIPNGLSVTWNHTVLVTSSQVAKLLEYTTLGVLLREICLTGAITRPCHSMEIMKDKFIVATDSELYLVSPKGAMTNHAQTEGKVTEKKAEKLGNDRETTEPSKGMEATSTEEEMCKNEDPGDDEVKEGATVNEAPEVEPIVSDADKQEGEETLKVVAEALQDIGAAGVKPIRICTDQFGFIFVLTETKVHLLSPELKYVRELISLDSLGMQNPKHIHFQPESGRLYVASTGGTKQLLAFQVTEGKVNQCTWKK